MPQEWTVVDGKAFTLVTASNQKEAIKKALKDGYVPSRSSDARPRTGDATLMTRKEFNKFIASVTQS